MDALAVGTVLLCPAVLPALLAQERGRCLRKRNENNLDPTISTVGKSRDSFRGPHDEQASPISYSVSEKQQQQSVSHPREPFHSSSLDSNSHLLSQ